MDRKELMQAVEQRAFAARITLHALCRRAGISGTTSTRWLDPACPIVPSLPTIGKLEREIAKVEAERASA